MPSTPISIRAFFITSWLLGWLMVFDGLYQRLWDTFWPGAGVVQWASVAGALGLNPAHSGWLLVVCGLCLVGASFGLYLKRLWGYASGLLISGLALSYFWLGTVLAVACLVLLLLPATRAYWQSANT